MTDKPPESKKAFSADWFLQGALTRIGDTLDRFTGRRWIPSSSLATSELIERMKKLLDAEAKQVPGKGVLVPHNIKLKMQWDKFSTDSEDALEKLQTELLTAAADHVNDSLYYTYAPLKLEVKPDYFTEGVRLFVSFEQFSEEEREAALNVTLPAMDVSKLAETSLLPPKSDAAVFIARFELKGSPKDRRLEVRPGGRVSVGRTGGSDLVIDDASVSKIHASLAVDSERGISVADTGSTNGTFINGQRIAYGKATLLADGDKVKFGVVEVSFEYVPTEPADLEIPQPTEDVTGNETIEIGGFEFTSRTTTVELAEKPSDETTEVQITASDTKTGE